MAGTITINAAETTFEVNMDVAEINDNPVLSAMVDEKKIKGDIDFIGVLYYMKQGGLKIRYKDGHTFFVNSQIISNGIHSNGQQVTFANNEELYQFCSQYKK